MTYSCAVFERPAPTLAEAQEAKIDRLCTKLELAPTDHLVEIGSGWGGLAVHAASRYGCRVTTTTISDAQRSYVEKRVADAGLGRSASRCSVWTGGISPGGSTSWCRSRWSRRWTGAGTTSSWPSVPTCWLMTGSPPSRPSSSTIAASSGPNVIRISCVAWCSPAGASPRCSRSRPAWPGPPTCVSWIWRTSASHYVETLRRWADNLAVHAEAVAALGAGREFRRLWDLYLAYCEASFLERHISDVQLVLAKPADRRPIERPTASPADHRAQRAAASSSTARTKSSPRRPLKPSAPGGAPGRHR